MTPRRPAPPLWFSVCAAVALAVLCRAVLGGVGQHATLGGRALEVQLGFWQLIALAIGWAWNALQAAGQVTLEVLAWAVKVLQSGAATMANGIKDVANTLRKGFLSAWGFLQNTYDDVLKPAWQKFWKWFDKARAWLKDTFDPLLEHLRAIRDALLNWYKTYIRPWLDGIDVTRRLLRVLSGLGLSFAKQLDAELGALEEKIDAPFRFVLSKVNEIIGIVNRVVTADGLFQRVALLRSVARDYGYVWNALLTPYQPKDSGGDEGTPAVVPDLPIVDGVADDMRTYFSTGGGDAAPTIEAAAARYVAYFNS